MGFSASPVISILVAGSSWSAAWLSWCSAPGRSYPAAPQPNYEPLQPQCSCNCPSQFYVPDGTLP
eukprot:13158337-Heterocapsa_arctica.AAC.1